MSDKTPNKKRKIEESQQSCNADNPLELLEMLAGNDSTEPASGLSPVSEIIQLKDQIRSIKSLCDELVKKKTAQVHALLADMSPLLALEKQGTLARVLSFLDAEELFVMEQASEAIKQRSLAAKQAWKVLDERRPDAGKLIEIENVANRSRAFEETAIFAKRMEVVAEEPQGDVWYNYGERRLVLKWPGCGELSTCGDLFSNIAGTDPGNDDKVFVRLSLRKPDESERTLLWQGFVKAKKFSYSREHGVSMSWEAAQVMKWPGLEDVDLGRLNDTPYYNAKMKLLLRNTRITAVCNKVCEDSSANLRLIVATEGFYSSFRSTRWVIFRLRNNDLRVSSLQQPVISQGDRYVYTAALLGRSGALHLRVYYPS